MKERSQTTIITDSYVQSLYDKKKDGERHSQNGKISLLAIDIVVCFSYGDLQFFIHYSSMNNRGSFH